MGLRAALPCLLLALALAPAALAQHGFVPPEDRALHLRLDAAQVVAIGTIERVDEGRIAVKDAEALRGDVAAAFELKRAPSTPPPWVPGERALLLLDGERSPYRWVEKPVEAESIRLASDEDVALWREAVLALEAARGDAIARRALYARWCDEGPEPLRTAGLRALIDIQTMFGLLDEPFARERAGVAADATRAQAARVAAAQVASRHPAGIAALLAHLREAGAEADGQVAATALEAGLRVRDPGAEPALSHLLRSSSTELRTVALSLVVFAQGLETEQALAELAVGHAEASVREQATTALKKLRRNRERRGS